MLTSENISAIIAKRLHGQATEEELQQLQLWMAADAAHQQEYEQLVKIWNQSAIALSAADFDTSAAWSTVDMAIKNNQHASAKVVPFFRKKTMIAAAALTGTVALAWFAWSASRPKWENVTAVNNNQSLHLPDGSVVLLRKGSTLAYPAVFDKKERVVKLTGEAFFEVRHNEAQPFLANTSNAAIKVLGTSFLVHTSSGSDEVVVVTGRVSVTEKDRNQQVVVSAGQKCVLQNDRFIQTALTDSNYIAWKTGLLDFKNAPLAKVLEDAANYYGTSLELASDQSPAAGNMPVTVHFDNQPLDEVVEELRLITGLQVKKENDKVVFYQK
jgi:transmembrane sensor